MVNIPSNTSVACHICFSYPLASLFSALSVDSLPQRHSNMMKLLPPELPLLHVHHILSFPAQTLQWYLIARKIECSTIDTDSVAWIWWFMGAQTFGEMLFQGMSVKVFLEEISIWISGLHRADGPLQCGWASFNPLKTWTATTTKAKVGRIISLLGCLIWDMPSDWDLQYTFSSLASEVFGLGRELHYQLLWVSSLQIVDYEAS